MDMIIDIAQVCFLFAKRVGRVQFLYSIHGIQIEKKTEVDLVAIAVVLPVMIWIH